MRTVNQKRWLIDVIVGFIILKDKEIVKKNDIILESIRELLIRKCVICGKHYSATRKSSLYCSQECLHKSIIPEGKNNYVYNNDYKNERWKHRAIAKKILGRPLNTNEVVHHIDFNPKNNSLDNLLVISRDKHNSLHRFLNIQGAVLK